jgi:glyoxylase-like metal-dependent hydrolase (beta-lactamase superfamily II)
MPMKPEQLLPDLFLFRDTCNVYLLRDGDAAIAMDFGSGRWLGRLSRLGIRRLEHVLLTHHHADQCAGLTARTSWPFAIHAPAGEERFLTPTGVRAFWGTQRHGAGVPSSYSVLRRGIARLRFDLAGFSDFWWGDRRIRAIHTPGHGPNALSLVADVNGSQVVFCGDAAHAGATIWQPYHLEWDHWTGTGALAAWEGVRRLANIGMDLLCPSHGSVVSDTPRGMLERLAGKLLAFYHAKGHICPGERDHYLTPRRLDCGGREILPHLFQFGGNSYLLVSDNREAMIIDPTADLALVKPLLRELGNPRVTAATATHYHSDHSDGLPEAKRTHGATVWLHPWVAKPLRRPDPGRFLWLPKRRVRADRFWPERGRWRWNEYGFQIAPFPGQTWWHCAFQTDVDGRRVFFGGDNFQPASRWNATGGFCAANGSRFDGFRRSAQLLLDWRPEIIACGHGTCYRFHAPQFRKIIAWAKRAETVTRSLCPTHDLDRDYYMGRV